MPSHISFPAPIGGVPFREDFRASVLFACVYAFLVLTGLYRLARKASRTFVIIGTFAFASERVVIWVLRAKQAITPSEDLNRNLTSYWQITFATAYISIYFDLINLLRCLVVPTTHGGPRDYHLPECDNADSMLLEYPKTACDRPRMRFRWRRAFDVMFLLGVAPFVTGTVMGYDYVSAESDTQKAANVQILRYVTVLMAIVLLGIGQILTIYSLFIVHPVKRGPAVILLLIFSALLSIPIYQLLVMHDVTRSLISMSPGSQNSLEEKAIFYLFQVVPELLAAGILLSINIRVTFDTGMWGDRFSDPKASDGTPRKLAWCKYIPLFTRWV